MGSKYTIKRDLKYVLASALALTVLGLIFIYSSSSVFAAEKRGCAEYFLKRQLFFLIPALTGFVFFASVRIDAVKRYSPIIFLISLFLTSLTLLQGANSKIHGASRWIFGVSLQPSEVLKFFLMIYIGFFVEKKQTYIKSFRHSYVPFLTVLALTFFILLKQPDFGSIVTIFASTFIVIFVANFKMIHMAVTAAAFIPAALVLIALKPYRMNRILIFLDPWSDPKGRGFQIIQSMIAIGSGSLWGLGIANSKQKFFYLPMLHTDFIFSIIAEETGLIGSSIIVFLYVLICYHGIRIVFQLESLFAKFTVLGLISIINIQAITNLMVVTGLVPTKGLGLPFVSYGGTALVCSWSMLGLVANFVKNEKRS